VSLIISAPVWHSAGTLRVIVQEGASEGPRFPAQDVYDWPVRSGVDDEPLLGLRHGLRLVRTRFGSEPLKRIVVIAGVIMLAAGCSGHPGSPSPGGGTKTARGTQSYKDGIRAGEGIAVRSNQTLAQRITKCQALATKQMPANDAPVQWTEGCTVGTYLGQSGAGN
jgi:hypothetical protein